MGPFVPDTMGVATVSKDEVLGYQGTIRGLAYRHGDSFNLHGVQLHKFTLPMHLIEIVKLHSKQK